MNTCLVSLSYEYENKWKNKESLQNMLGLRFFSSTEGDLARTVLI